jgi:hypothetical protein
MRCLSILSLVLALLAAADPSGAMRDWRMPEVAEKGPEIGCEFPDFPLPDTSGKMVWFNDYKGKVLLVSFCSCYTDTCCSVIETLEKIRGSHNGNLLTVMVCCETAPALEKDGFQLLRTQCRDAADVVLIDKIGETLEPFRIGELPTTYLIDGDFCVRYKAESVGALNMTEFLEELDRALEDYPQPEGAR